MKKLISFSLYGDSNRYLRGAIRNAEMRQEFYPDWTCRFYVADDVPRKTVEQLKSNGAEIVLCGGDTPLPPMFWRFLAAVDKDVDICIVRDADSRPSTRERRMVDEWLASGKAFHIIRDHPSHRRPIMGGLWGCLGGRIPHLHDALIKGSELCGNKGADDQRFLWVEVYPLIKDDVLIHSRFIQFPGEHPVSPPSWKESPPPAVGCSADARVPCDFYESPQERPITTVRFILPRRVFLHLKSVYRFFNTKVKSKGKEKMFSPRSAPRALSVSVAERAKNPARKLIAFSLTRASWRHIRGVIRNIEMQKEIYPDWACRFYVSPEIPADWVSQIRGYGADVIVADTRRLGNHPCCWSFSAVAEKSVEVVLVRDVLSRPTARERRMVDEWLASGKAFHIIRDAPWQESPIPNGVWGFRSGCASSLSALARDRGAQYECGTQFLCHEIYPRIKDDVLIHSRFIQFPGEKLTTPPPWEEPPPYAAGVTVVYPERFYLECGAPTPTMYPLPQHTTRGVSFSRQVKK